MPSLSDKLKSLGVKVGAQDLPKPAPRPTQRDFSLLEQVLAGHPHPTEQGETFCIDSRYAPGYQHGRFPLHLDAPLHTLATWANEERITAYPPQSFAFLDTETTGLAGGTGTYAFLIGAGRFEGDEFHLAQFFMRDPLEEPAQLYALEEFLAPCQAIVTFNGKSFDVPLLNTRYVQHGWRTPFIDTAHVDLLHLARRLWRDRLPSRTLGNLEVQILGALRSEEDLPGWMIPSLYFEYLRDGNPEPLRRVIYHNAMDVVSMVALFNHMAAMLANPLEGRVEHGVDLIALARLYEDLGQVDAATQVYLHALDHDDTHQHRVPEPVLIDAIMRLALIYKRGGAYDQAAALWEKAAEHGHLPAFVELAKLYEHTRRDPPEAARWTVAAIEQLARPSYTAWERASLLPDLDHRLERLKRKMG